MSKKIVVKLDLHDKKDKRKAMKAVSALAGIDEISVDMASHKMTVIGTVDPVNVVSKLRKASWPATIDSVGPAKEPEKKEGGEKGKDGDGKKAPAEQQVLAELMSRYWAYHPYPYMTTHHYAQSMEENPNPCTIC